MSNFLLLPLVIVGTYVVTTDHTKDKVIVAILLFVQGKRTLLRSLIPRVFLLTKVNVDMSRVVWESEQKRSKTSPTPSTATSAEKSDKFERASHKSKRRGSDVRRENERKIRNDHKNTGSDGGEGPVVLQC